METRETKLEERERAKLLRGALKSAQFEWVASKEWQNGEKERHDESRAKRGKRRLG